METNTCTGHLLYKASISLREKVTRKHYELGYEDRITRNKEDACKGLRKEKKELKRIQADAERMREAFLEEKIRFYAERKENVQKRL